MTVCLLGCSSAATDSGNDAYGRGGAGGTGVGAASGAGDAGGGSGSGGSGGPGATGGSGGSGVTGAGGSGAAAGKESGGTGGSVGSSAGASGSAGSSGAGAVAGAGGEGGAPGDCTPPAQPLSPGDHEFTIQSANGMTYRYTLVIPRALVPNKKAPLSVVWHALQSSPEETRGLTDVDARSEAIGSISVHPRSPDASWDTGSCCTNVVLGRRRDETVFVKELLADVRSKVCVDERRIYTAGFSNGGMMSQMLACKMADVFAAATPMASTLTVPAAECRPSRPIPIFMINGTADPLVGYSAPGLAGGLSVPDAFATWGNRNGCTGSPVVTLQQGKASCRTYKQCAGGVEVTLCSVDGMGHCMPGMKKESAINCYTKLIPLGMPNDDINGVEMSLQFLGRFTLP